jgi:hypothetical protein
VLLIYINLRCVDDQANVPWKTQNEIKTHLLKISINLNLPTMKNFITLLGFLLCLYASAQTTNVTYTTSTAVISNPERGFYKHTSTNSALDQTTLTNYRLNNNITLIYREVRLDAFVSSPISAAFLASLSSDFTKLRNAGIKCIIRFSYGSDENASQRDATKALMLSHITQLTPLLQANADVIAVMQAGFIGTWGEWYYTSQSEFGGWGYDESDLTTANYNNRKDILNAVLAALPASRQVQIRYPAMKQHLFTSTALSNTQAFTGTAASRTAHHNDCFLASATDYGTYENSSTEYPYLAQETKFLAMGGETCKLNSPRSDCPTALLEMDKFHWSFLNLDYFGDVLDNFETDGCFPDIQKRLGYRFSLTSGTFPQAVALGTPLTVTLKVKNTGFAAPYNERHAYLVLKNLSTNQVYPIQMATDPRTWLGPNELTITENLTLPANLTSGNYKLYLSLPDAAPSLAAKPEFAIRLANDNVWESVTGYNNLNHTLNVTSGTLATADNSKLDMTIYPVPASSELNIELESISDYKIAFFNSIGQSVNVPVTEQTNKLIVNTSDLSEGLYFVQLSKGNIKDTRKIIVKH